jgi:glycosyltransferase involved in cell wall biosynthesis
VEESAFVINTCDVMIVPLRRLDVLTSFIPSKLFDLMCCAKPIIVMADGEARAIVEQAGAGVFVPPEDGSGLAAAICELRGTPEERRQMGSRGRSYVLGHYIRQNQAAQLEALLRSLTVRQPAS